MNKTIKSKIKAKNVLYKKYIQNERFESDFVCLKNIIIELKELIFSTKALYYNNKKIPLIPLLLVDNKFVTKIKTKTIIFSKYHAEPCTLVKNSSVIPSVLL